MDHFGLFSHADQDETVPTFSADPVKFPAFSDLDAATPDSRSS